MTALHCIGKLKQEMPVGVEEHEPPKCVLFPPFSLFVYLATNTNLVLLLLLSLLLLLLLLFCECD